MSTNINGMRRSLRLQESGYSDKEGKPTISYGGKVYRDFNQRRKGKGGRKINSDNMSEDNSFDGSSIISVINRIDTTPYISKTKWSAAYVLVLILVLAMIFIHVTPITSLLRPTHHESASTSSPVYNQGPSTSCEKMMMEIKKLQAELDYVTEKLSHQLPDQNLWTNFALESHGAKVHKKLSSVTYERIPGQSYFGIVFFSKWSPAVVIQGEHPPIPGNCWAFPGSHGNLLIELSHRVSISHVTLDNVAKSASPIDAISSAPRDFSVYGLQTLGEAGLPLGDFTFDLNGHPSQTFKVKVHDTMAFKYVNLKIEANYGHCDYTCLYGFRVHGTARQG